ncbi:MAG TPA: hypothetical protein DCZ95_18020 [Verrucomicrobia bacterium]|nr:hypothetical protein [Verrucomicrobiota bacterium]
MYFWVFNNIKNGHIKINLMGMIQFAKSAKKHIIRGNPSWMWMAQIRGFFMCFRQLLTGPQ